MSNISRLAPYTYLAKRSGSNIYDLLLLVPVDPAGDTDLSNVVPVKSGTRVTIHYATNGNSAIVPYRTKHWVIDSEGTFVDLEIKGDNLAERSVIIAFADADTEPATVNNQFQTCAPYVFARIEDAGSQKFIQPSCIVLFDPGLGAAAEDIIFTTASCSLNITLGNNGVVTDPTKFALNQKIKSLLPQNQIYTTEATVAGSTTYNKPPRKHKVKVIW